MTGPCDNGAAACLAWEERRPARGEARKCRARLPDGRGWVNLTEYDGTGYRHGSRFALHYMMDDPPDGLPRFQGMVFLEGLAGSMDGLKARAMEIMAEDMEKKLAAHEAKMASIRGVLTDCRPG